jgi:hypothetical protein
MDVREQSKKKIKLKIIKNKKNKIKRYCFGDMVNHTRKRDMWGNRARKK